MVVFLARSPNKNLAFIVYEDDLTVLKRKNKTVEFWGLHGLTISPTKNWKLPKLC